MLGRHGASQTLNTMLDVFTSLKDWISSIVLYTASSWFSLQDLLS